MARDIVWEWLDRPGLEHLSLQIGPTAVTAEGLVLVQLGPAPLRVTYRVELDGDWRFRRAHLTAGADQTLDLARAADGAWSVDGQAGPDLAGATDIDIMVTPFTNSLPIRRLRFQTGEPQAIRVAYIALPDLTVEPAAQDYTQLAPDRFRYRSLSSDFKAELTVDGDGVVIDYPPIWRRRSS